MFAQLSKVNRSTADFGHVLFLQNEKSPQCKKIDWIRNFILTRYNYNFKQVTKMCGHKNLNSFFFNLAVCLCSQNSPATVVGLLDHISVLNRDPDVHGVIVQLPLPLHLNEEVVCNAVDVTKDVDGFTTTNLGSLV